MAMDVRGILEQQRDQLLDVDLEVLEEELGTGSYDKAYIQDCQEKISSLRAERASATASVATKKTAVASTTPAPEASKEWKFLNGALMSGQSWMSVTFVTVMVPWLAAAAPALPATPSACPSASARASSTAPALLDVPALFRGLAGRVSLMSSPSCLAADWGRERIRTSLPGDFHVAVGCLPRAGQGAKPGMEAPCAPGDRHR